VVGVDIYTVGRIIYLLSLQFGHIMSSKRRTCKLFQLDFEDYGGPFIFGFDLICVLIAYVPINTFVNSSSPRSIDLYASTCLQIIIIQHVTRAFYYTISAFIVSDVMLAPPIHGTDLRGRWISVTYVIEFFLTALTGLRPMRGPIGLIETVWRWSWESIFQWVYSAAGLYFLLEVVCVSTTEPWFTTYTTYPPYVSEAGCKLEQIIETSARVFFEATNNAAMIDVLLALEGLYFTIMNWRSRLRVFLRYAFPGVQEACDGGNVPVTYDQDVVAQTATLVFVCVALLIPFTFFRECRRMMRNFYMWAFSFLSISLCATSMFLRNDAGTTFFALILPGSTMTRTYTPHGVNAFTALIVMAVCSAFMCLPSKVHDNDIDLVPALIPDIDVLGASSFSLMTRRTTSYIVQTVIVAYKRFFRLILSEAMIVAMIAFVVAWYVGSLGLPVSSIKVEKMEGKRAWPEYADLNDFEVAIYESRSLEDLAVNVVDKLADMNSKLAQYILGKIPCINIEVTRVCIGDLLSEPLDFMTSHLKDGLIFVIHKTFEVVRLSGPYLKDIEKTFADLLKPVSDFMFNIFDFINDIEDLISWVPDITRYIPLIFVALSIAIAFTGLLIPSLASALHLGLVTSLLHLVLGVTAAVLTIRRVLDDFGYRLVLTWNYATLVWDIVAVVVTVLCCFMLMMYDQSFYGYDAKTIRLIDNFNKDHNLEEYSSAYVPPSSIPLVQSKAVVRNRGKNGVRIISFDPKSKHKSHTRDTDTIPLLKY
jgi:hypothetical protein